MYPLILKRFVLPLADIAMKTRINYFYNLIKDMNNWSKNQIDEWQNEKLRNIISHAYNNTNYYNSLFNSIGISPEDIKKKEDLKIIPPLTKKLIRENYPDLISRNIQKIKFMDTATGGSTGDPLWFLLDFQSWSYLTANTIFYWEKTGYRFGEKYIALGSTSLFVNKRTSLRHSIYYKLKNKIGLCGINMSDKECASYVNLIKKQRIKYIYGYASSIYLFAKYIIKTNIRLNIDTCFPTSEILTDNYRKTIERAFNCRVLDGYGANDGGAAAVEVHQGFYEVSYNSIVTLSDVDCHNIGEVMLTDLLNYAMPFINYKLGDEVQIDKKKNLNYSYNGQIINKIYGRTSDVIRLENGHILTGPGFTILFKDFPVEAYSIEKIGPNSLLCNIKKLSNYTKKDENLIISTIKKHAGEDCLIYIKYVTRFKLTNSGKRSYFMTN